MPEDAKKLTEQQAVQLIAAMEQHAAKTPVLELTPENWEAEFGKDGKVQTPIGEVKMGEHQYLKMQAKGRGAELGMVKPTLTVPDAIIEEYDLQEDAERNTKLLFVKTFIDNKGGKYSHFESVTIKKDGLEVSISSHIVSKKAMLRKLTNGNIALIKPVIESNISEWHLDKNQNGLPDLVPSQESTTSDNKGTKISETTKKI
ncbi:MAG: hypothetical protein LBT94_06595 [Prevotellaceae bacterium]|jgi:hypothetical protein|nr:hypothetical protein [Prevotellaceae bacterium]